MQIFVGGAVNRVLSFPPSSSHFFGNTVAVFSFPPSRNVEQTIRHVRCSALQQESSAASPTVVTETKQVKPKAKAVLPLPEMMKEEVIPSLKAILEAHDDISEVELTFEDNKLEGCFVKKGNPDQRFSFWAFFPTGSLTGPKGFALSSYGLEPSTIEPFLIDEKKITTRHVVFWVEKRLAAQGIIPVWT